MIALKHIIWDWNGTMLDDRWLTIAAMNIVLARRNMAELTEDRYLQLFTFPVIEYYQRLGFDFDKEPFSVSGSEFINEYNARAFEPQLHDGIIDLIAELNENGVSHSILSASSQKILNKLAKHHNINHYFIAVLGQDNHYAYGKIETGKMWINKLGIAPKNTLFIGDTEHDLEVANAIGSHCALLSWGHSSTERLENRGINVFDAMSDLKSWINASFILPAN
ncbi:MAG TPA: HAD family hydrolase [Candidatus Marinimicrobia bacterium]|jgi:phosphoglycolate phosphatase|nr:HAD family hydrolase [Candidatus Neomarinimicrobiota bacterium]